MASSESPVEKKIMMKKVMGLAFLSKECQETYFMHTKKLYRQ
jgi:hypothetical protein